MYILVFTIEHGEIKEQFFQLTGLLHREIIYHSWQRFPKLEGGGLSEQKVPPPILLKNPFSNFASPNLQPPLFVAFLLWLNGCSRHI